MWMGLWESDKGFVSRPSSEWASSNCSRKGWSPLNTSEWCTWTLISACSKGRWWRRIASDLGSKFCCLNNRKLGWHTERGWFRGCNQGWSTECWWGDQHHILAMIISLVRCSTCLLENLPQERHQEGEEWRQEWSCRYRWKTLAICFRSRCDNGEVFKTSVAPKWRKNVPSGERHVELWRFLRTGEFGCSLFGERVVVEYG